jgi:two-component system cell cycle response regulator
MGDQVIQYMGNTLKASFPTDSLAVRLGGEEFGVLLAGFSDEDVLERGNQFAREVAGHVHQAQGKCFRLTVSVGIAHLQNARQSLYDLMLMADRALYRSKDAGRNRVSR